jgi:splicing factor 1
MHELAVLNGTLREIDVKCLNCGKDGHRTWECTENAIFTSSVICQACGGVGHVSKCTEYN